ncbi:amidohydrolase family protein [Chelatococcus asaccharovorans]|uniref:Putative TIM-barrel fold metal-dependent hydrolase n=1 Tax=Chelatococcus asaccharovorans TaxID=28210 RepID=A0A2V3UB89_9HYPH|nr:amidohydrolase [Chelatococcus asaccharovorans]MBS7703361.1 amidohydrolase [Chelatococcus asaccharovorans]PXW61699.1 putative TIM-barrel fold metal-dependent hydrolase [Chelatococcus asaccharovorans]
MRDQVHQAGTADAEEQASARGSTAQPPNLIDTHLHLIEPHRFAYPWIAHEPGLQRAFTLDSYWHEAQALGITAALHMEVDVAPDQAAAEAAYTTGLGAPVVGAIAGCRPDLPGFAEHTERLAANPLVKGLRHVFQGKPEIYENPLLVENLRRLAPLGLTFDLCVLGHELPLATALAARCPDVTFVLDHCGKPGAGPPDAWKADMAALARLPSVTCKFSGLISYAAPTEWTVEDLRPAAAHVIDVFGWDRLVWGSDWPVCTLTGSLTRWVEATHALIRGSSPTEQSQLFATNAARIYRLA